MQVNELKPQFEALTDDELRAKTDEFTSRRWLNDWGGEEVEKTYLSVLQSIA